jgi:hypothetical protein
LRYDLGGPSRAALFLRKFNPPFTDVMEAFVLDLAKHRESETGLLFPSLIDIL